jgi:aminoglycoside/choline kinase family phosphotransferase/GTP:adenosylcobinamide-phosphate guanylyltransferase
MEHLSKLFADRFGISPVNINRLPGAGGNRVYYRLSDNQGNNALGVIGDSRRDCEAFISLSELFINKGINVPEIYGADDDRMHYLEQDLGDTSLFSILNDKDRSEPLVADSLRELARMQLVDADDWKQVVKYPDFSRRQVLWDLNYFKYEFLKPMAIDFDEDALEDDFDAFADYLTADNIPTGFMFRDFQSRNVMIFGEKPYFIDYQAGRRGPILYDAVSFLWQAKAGFSDEFRDSMLNIYAEQVAEIRSDISKESLLKDLNIFAAFRTLQVLGAYGFRGLVEKRAHFIESIPGALNNLRTLLSRGVFKPYKELEAVCANILNNSRFDKEFADGLHIKVFSFSYKKGYPEDLTGNGGGFMFDCRGMHNPGRYDEFKPLTGRDKPVIDFLQERGEVDVFTDRAVELVSPTVECYLRRGFNNLQIGFGCTGGRHRSVYCAERTARMLAQKYPAARVSIIHREQNIHEDLYKTAFILAAGLGTRLKPWTNEHPKALVPVGDKPMLQRVIEKLKSQGYNRIVVNVHHFAEQIVDFLNTHDFGISIKVSDETERLLDTGGGVANAAPLFNLSSDAAVLVHNVDILSDADLTALMDYHHASDNDITLLTSDRSSSRKLAFNKEGLLSGWHNLQTGATRPDSFTPSAEFSEEAFSGIYILSAKALDSIKNYREHVVADLAFPIMDFFLTNPDNLRIGRLHQPSLHLIDIGKPDTLAEARQSL